MEPPSARPQSLTPELVIQHYDWTLWYKHAPKKIRPFILQDSALLGSSFTDLEGREHRVEVGRCGSLGDRWTCSLASLERDRIPISELDNEGFRFYQMR